MSGPRIGALCAGYGGLDLAVQEVLGGELVWYAEKDPAAAKVLALRFPGVPNLGDITEVDWAAVEPVDIVTAGFPCQDLSVAGARAGLVAGSRSGLWFHIVKALAVLRPPLVILENVRGLLSARADSDVEPCPWCLGDGSGEPPLRALGAVLADLAELGLDAEWTGLRAADVGACHGRSRVGILAWPASDSRGDRRDEGRPEPAWVLRGPDAAECGPAVAADPGRHPWAQDDPDGAPAGWCRGTAPDTLGALGRPGNAEHGHRPEADGGRGSAALGRRGRPAAARLVDWGPYARAIRRWELILGRPAPAPTEPSKNGQRLSARFVEWMQGLDDGWVTDVPGLSRSDMLRILGNGVVPQQFSAVIRILLGRAFGVDRAA